MSGGGPEVRLGSSPVLHRLNLLIFLWERLAPRVPGEARVVRLRLREDVDLRADYYGPKKEAGPHREALA